MDPLLVIANAGAGTADALDPALKVLRAHGEVEVARPDGPDDLDGVLDTAGDRTLVMAGGDGSVQLTVATLHRRGELGDHTLALLPLGTGNDVARGLGLPLDPVEAAHVVVTGRRRPMDLLVDDTGRVVVNSVHAGAGATAARAGESWKRRLGRAGYAVGALLTAVGLADDGPPAVRLRVEVDGEVVHEGDVLQVAVGNGSSVGGGTELTPDANFSDGLADVMVSLAAGPLARFGYVLDLVRRRHHERHDVLTRRGRHVVVSGEEFWCSADGETHGPQTRRAWRVEPGAYELVVP